MPDISQNVVPNWPYPLRVKSSHGRTSLKPAGANSSSVKGDRASKFVAGISSRVAKAAKAVALNIPQATAQASGYFSKKQTFGVVGDSFTISLKQSKLGNYVSLEHVHPVVREGIPGTVIAVDAMSFLISSEGNRSVIRSISHHLQSAKFKGTLIEERETGKTAGVRIAGTLLEKLEEFGPKFVEEISSPRQALEVTYVLMDAQSKLANPDKSFHSLHQVRKSPSKFPVGASARTLGDLASELDALVNPRLPLLDRVLPL